MYFCEDKQKVVGLFAYHLEGFAYHSLGTAGLSGSSQNFDGSCPGYIPRKLACSVCVIYSRFKFFLTEQPVFNTFECNHCVYRNSNLWYINVAYNVQIVCHLSQVQCIYSFDIIKHFI